jgi:hypothetical protein
MVFIMAYIASPRIQYSIGAWRRGVEKGRGLSER